jgi:hypothetical protein
MLRALRVLRGEHICSNTSLSGDRPLSQDPPGQKRRKGAE